MREALKKLLILCLCSVSLYRAVTSTSCPYFLVNSKPKLLACDGVSPVAPSGRSDGSLVHAGAHALQHHAGPCTIDAWHHRSCHCHDWDMPLDSLEHSGFSDSSCIALFLMHTFRHTPHHPHPEEVASAFLSTTSFGLVDMWD